MGIFDKADYEKRYELVSGIRDRIIDYLQDNVAYPTESNMAKFLSNHELPAGIYRQIGSDKEILWGVKDTLPRLMAKKFDYNFKRYYINRLKRKKARFKKVNTVNSACLTALLKK